jgi:hypothetical protein
MARSSLMTNTYPAGWDTASLAEFDRRWLAGHTIVALAAAFDVCPQYVCRVRRGRGLPTRRGADGRWRGGRYPVTHVPTVPRAARRAGWKQKAACAFTA